MSEKLQTPTQEHNNSVEKGHQRLEQQKRLQELQKKAEKATPVSQDTIENIQKSIESASISSQEYSIGTNETKQAPPPRITKQLKNNAYKKVLKKTRSELKPTEKTFSKVIHNPTIEKVSDIGAKTVARPSGILFGGIGAFIGSLLLLIISKRTGFSYNYLLFLLIFIGGYLAGLILEVFYRLIKLGKK